MGASDLPLHVRQRIERRWTAQAQRLRQSQSSCSAVASAAQCESSKTNDPARSDDTVDEYRPE